MILKDIETKLRELDKNVFYGAVPARMKEDLWNYTVFNRAPTKVESNRNGYTDFFDINVVRENYIPEDTDKEYIQKILELDGFRLASNDIEYTYTKKGKTDTVVEMLTIRVLKARK